MSYPLLSSSSPSSRPSSPAKPGQPLGYQPNPHPYAIKTTSTGILSRSSTTSNSVSPSYNHYVPLTPSASPTRPSFSHSSRGSKHRYSRSFTDESLPRPLPAPPDDPSYHPHQSRGRAETLPIFDAASPKRWSPAQLAENIPEIATFVEENEITGRAFLRFDEGVLDAYGITQQWQRSLILSASHNLRQSILRGRIGHQGQAKSGYSTFLRSSGSASVGSSPTKSYVLSLPNEDQDDPDLDQAYLSSSSSSSSLAGRPKRKDKARPNSRVHGIVASLERPSGVDGHKAALLPRRERSDSTSSFEDFAFQHNYATLESRPLPFTPTRPYLVEIAKPDDSVTAPSFLLSPTEPGEGFVTPQTTGVTRTRTIGDSLSPRSPRPLPPPPPPPFLRHPFLNNTDQEIPSPLEASEEDSSGEVSMDQLLSILGPETGSELPFDATSPLGNLTTGKPKFTNWLPVQGGAAWIARDVTPGETVKHAVAAVGAVANGVTSPAIGLPVRALVKTEVEEELTVEELLALEDGESVHRGGVSAWLNGVEDEGGVGVTVKRVVLDGPGKGRVSSNQGSRSRKGKGQYGDRVGDVFSVVEVGREQEVIERVDPSETVVIEEKEREGGDKSRAVGSQDFRDDPGPEAEWDKKLFELKTDVEGTRHVVEELRKRVVEVENRVGRMEAEFEMQRRTPFRSQGEENEEILLMETQAGGQKRILSPSSQQDEGRRHKNKTNDSTVSQGYTYEPAWIHTLFQAILGLPRCALGVFSSQSTALLRSPRCTLAYIRRRSHRLFGYALGVPQYVLTAGTAVPRYALWLGIGMCVVVMKAVKGRGRGLIRRVLEVGGGLRGLRK